MATTTGTCVENTNTSDEGKESALKEASANALHADRPNIKKDWYQTDSNVVVTFFIKNLQKDDVHVNITSQQVTCKFLSTNEDHTPVTIQLNLLHQVSQEQSSYKVLPTKIEIKLKKEESFWWENLEGNASPSVPKQLMAAASPANESGSPNAAGPTYPSSCTQKRDWNRIASDIQKDEASEKLEGESALNQLFQKIYAEGTDEVKKAMNKSFMESGGTVLSTNWKDVGNKHVQVNPPDGLEFRKWES